MTLKAFDAINVSSNNTVLIFKKDTDEEVDSFLIDYLPRAGWDDETHSRAFLSGQSKLKKYGAARVRSVCTAGTVLIIVCER